MNVDFESETISRTYRIEGAPLVQLRYRQSQIIPERVEVTFTDGEWKHLTVGGPRAKKDGSPGADHSEESWRGRYDLDKIPDWLTPFTDPNTDPTR